MCSGRKLNLTAIHGQISHYFLNCCLTDAQDRAHITLRRSLLRIHNARQRLNLFCKICDKQPSNLTASNQHFMRMNVTVWRGEILTQTQWFSHQMST